MASALTATSLPLAQRGLTTMSETLTHSRFRQAHSNMGVEKNKERIAGPANKTTFVISILATLRYMRLKASA